MLEPRAKTRPGGGSECIGRSDRYPSVARHGRYPQMQLRRSLEDAIIIARVEMLEQPHVRHCVERRATGQYEPVAAGRADETVNDVDEGILEQHLGGRRLVEPFLRIGLVPNVLDTKDRIGVPHILGRYG